MSRGDIYGPYPNAFAMEPSVGDEIITVRRFIKARGYERPAFIGFGGDLYAERIEEALNPKDGEGTPVTTHWLPGAHTDPLDEAGNVYPGGAGLDTGGVPTHEATVGFGQ